MNEYTVKAVIISGMGFYKVVKRKRFLFITYYVSAGYGVTQNFSKADKLCNSLNNPVNP